MKAFGPSVVVIEKCPDRAGAGEVLDSEVDLEVEDVTHMKAIRAGACMGAIDGEACALAPVGIGGAVSPQARAGANDEYRSRIDVSSTDDGPGTGGVDGDSSTGPVEAARLQDDSSRKVVQAQSVSRVRSHCGVSRGG